MRSIFKVLVMCSLVGALVCAYHNHWLIFLLPRTYGYSAHLHAEPESKRVSLIWWQEGRWQKESASLLWPTDMSVASESLIRTWLLTIGEEKNEQYATLLQAVLFSELQNTLYISFTKSPFHKQLSMHDKLVWIEGLCRTLQSNGIGVTHIQFCIDHKLFLDPHLDFSCAWPIQGYMSASA